MRHFKLVSLELLSRSFASFINNNKLEYFAQSTFLKMAKAKKATKKFKRSSLPRVLQQRRNEKSFKAKLEQRRGTHRHKNDQLEQLTDEHITGDENEQQMESKQSQSDSTQSVEQAINSMSAEEFLSSKFFEDDDDENISDSDSDSDSDFNEDDYNDDDDAEQDDEKFENDIDALNSAQDSEADSDDEDLDDAQLLNEIEEHEKAIAALAEKDPELYQHLKQNDAELLKFSKEQLLKEEQQMQGMNGDQDDKPQSKLVKIDSSAHTLTSKEWQLLHCELTQSPTLSTIRKVLRVWLVLVHTSDADSIDTSRDNATKLRQSIIIGNNRIMNNVIQTVAGPTVYNIFEKFLNVSEGKKQLANKQSKSVGTLLKSFLSSTLHFLTTIVDPVLQRFALTHLQDSIFLYNYYPKLQHKLLNQLLVYWSGEHERNVRIDAFLCIYNMFLTASNVSHSFNNDKIKQKEQQSQGLSIQDQILKSTYMSYVRSAKFVTPTTLPVIDFLANCVVELFAINQSVSYSFAFVYIRQLAIHLRNAISPKKTSTDKKADNKISKPKSKQTADACGSYKSIYNWQFINCLRVWAKLIAFHTDSTQHVSKPLSQLLYPLMQILMSTLNVHPVTRYYPLKLIVIQFILMISEQQHTFVPIALLLTDVFSCHELTVPPRVTSRGRDHMNFDTCLKVNDKLVDSKVYQTQLVTRTCDLILHYFSIYSYSIAFPELVVNTIRSLKKFTKITLIHRIRKQVGNVVGKLEMNREWIIRKRMQCELTPLSLTAEQSILTFKNDDRSEKSPLAEFVQTQTSNSRSYSSRSIIADNNDSTADWTGSMKKANKMKQKQSDDRSDSNGGDAKEMSEDIIYSKSDDDDEISNQDDSMSVDIKIKKESNSKAQVNSRSCWSDGDDEIDENQADVLTKFELSDDEGNKREKKHNKQTHKNTHTKKQINRKRVNSKPQK